jgi:hypothetical protein
MKKYIISFIVLCLLNTYIIGQSVSINNDASAPDASAILDVKSSSKGMLCPRMLEAERIIIALPAKGLLVYQTDGAEGYYYNSGTDIVPNWVRLAVEKTTVAFSANTTAVQGFSPTAYVKVQFNTEEYDETGNFVHGTPSEFTAPTAGVYHFSTAVVLTGGSGSRYDVAFFVNGVQRKNVLQFLNNQYMSLALSADFKLSANDKVDVRVAAGSFPGQLLGTSPQWIFFTGHKVN